MDVRIQQSVLAGLARRPASIEAGPFLIGIDPGTPSPWINYATPRPGETITAGDVRLLADVFREKRRKPRLEYVVTCAPALEPLLTDAGWIPEARRDYMTCTPGSLTGEPPGIEPLASLSEPRTDEERAALIAAQNEGFGGPAAAGAADVARMRRLQSDGGIALMAVTPDGFCVGGGEAGPQAFGVSAVVGIAVRPRFRRRGIARAVTSAITRKLFATGTDIAWLEASGPDSWRVYERVGYRAAGQRLYIGKS
ncbi:GNAT family N-acetyltransferase [Actinoplanes sp. TBRC 11911]|nr:GNAT family N-acetyltransferase [Actinoplanes sp. TBRC 11911]